jgi:hypothetical protein
MIPKTSKPVDRAKLNAARMAYYYEVERPRSEMAYCSICGGVLRRGGFSHQVGFHQKCDPNEYMRLWRMEKKVFPKTKRRTPKAS